MFAQFQLVWLLFVCKLSGCKTIDKQPSCLHRNVESELMYSNIYKTIESSLYGDVPVTMALIKLDYRLVDISNEQLFAISEFQIRYKDNFEIYQIAK